MNLFLSISLVVIASAFWGCTTDSSESIPNLAPDNSLDFWIYPNDGANYDSASRQLSHGLVIDVHPNAVYSMSFDADTVAGAPRMLLYRMTYLENDSIRLNRVRSLKPALENGRYVYKFACEERDAVEWVAVLEKNGTYYQGSTKNVRLEGDGAYSDHLSLNLVVTGNVASKLEGFTIDELATEILAGFRKFYTSITIDTIYISYAHEHPVYGAHYPANEPWVAGRSDRDVMMQSLGGGWPGKENALDLVLVHYIDEVGLMGYSFLFSGNLGSGVGSTVVLGAFVKTNMGQVPVNIEDIAETAVHESGHFLGLRHTTSSRADMEAVGDYSIIEDGLTDTPYCEEFLKSGLMKTRSSEGTDFKVRYGNGGRRILMGRNTFDGSSCPDASNLMFPAEVGVEYEALTPQQLDLVRKNLMIYPH